MNEIPVLLQLAALFVGLGTYTWGIVTFILNSMEKKMEMERAERLSVQDDIYKKLDASKESSVRREDFNRHVDYVEKQFGSFRVDLNSNMQGLAARLDSVIVLITKGAAGK